MASGYGVQAWREFSREIEAAILSMKDERKDGFILGGKITGRFIELDAPDNLVVVGDLHGDLQSLQAILKDIYYNDFFKNKSNKLIFLGDYVDRGPDSLGVLFTCCRLKNAYPDSIFLLWGNHEVPAEFPLMKTELPIDIMRNFGTANARQI